MSKNLYLLSADLPVPDDDGACNHLKHMELPHISLQSTDGSKVKLNELKGWSVIFCYPMTGNPKVDLPENWDNIPGARGCTPQSCGFNSNIQEIMKYVRQIYGLSAQPIDFQMEAKTRLNLSYDLLGDPTFEFTSALRLPTFSAENKKYMKRVTLICKNNVIEHVMYPIFPPNKNAEDVIDWFKNQAGRSEIRT